MNRPTPDGFTLLELMVVVAVLGLVSAVTIQQVTGYWQRERLNAATMELTGWLEEVAAGSQQQSSSCTVTLTTGASRAGGSELARVSPAACAREPVLLLPSLHQSASFAVGSSLSPSSWTYSPRGTISSTDADISIRLSLGGSAPLRCVRVSGTLGVLRLGRDNSRGSVSSECSDWSRS